MLEGPRQDLFVEKTRYELSLRVIVLVHLAIHVPPRTAPILVFHLMNGAFIKPFRTFSTDSTSRFSGGALSSCLGTLSITVRCNRLFGACVDTTRIPLPDAGHEPFRCLHVRCVLVAKRLQHHLFLGTNAK